MVIFLYFNSEILKYLISSYCNHRTYFMTDRGQIARFHTNSLPLQILFSQQPINQHTETTTNDNDMTRNNNLQIKTVNTTNSNIRNHDKRRKSVLKEKLSSIKNLPKPIITNKNTNDIIQPPPVDFESLTISGQVEYLMQKKMKHYGDKSGKKALAFLNSTTTTIGIDQIGTTQKRKNISSNLRSERGSAVTSGVGTGVGNPVGFDNVVGGEIGVLDDVNSVLTQPKYRNGPITQLDNQWLQEEEESGMNYLNMAKLYKTNKLSVETRRLLHYNSAQKKKLLKAIDHINAANMNELSPDKKLNSHHTHHDVTPNSFSKNNNKNSFQSKMNTRLVDDSNSRLTQKLLTISAQRASNPFFVEPIPGNSILSQVSSSAVINAMKCYDVLPHNTSCHKHNMDLYYFLLGFML